MYQRIFTLLLFCILFTSNSLYAERVIIYTQVQNPTDTYVGFAYKKTPEAEDASFFRIDLKNNNEAQFELNIDATKFVELHYAGQIMPLFIEVGDELRIHFDGNHLYQTIRFEGKGSQNNNTLAQYKQQFRSKAQKEYDWGYLKTSIDQVIADKAAASTAAQYASSIQSMEKSQLAFLEQKRSSISTFLYQYLQTEIKYTNASNRIAWFLEHQYEELQRSKSAINVLQGVSLSDGALLTHTAYQNFLRNYVFFTYLPNDLYRYKLQFPFYEIGQKTFSDKVKYHVLSDLLIQVYNRSGEGDLAFKYFKDFVNQNPYSEYTEKVIAAYGNTLSGVASVDAPDFEMINPEEKPIKLSDYEGKVVYLSFWASWCKPCIEGFHKSAAIREQLQDMGVVLLNVSIDKKEAAWRESMAKHQPIGINGLVLSLEDISKKYNISSIPLYQIIDKDGKFAFLSENAQRDILEEFRQLVVN